jgi:hypothetical protein
MKKINARPIRRTHRAVVSRSAPLSESTPKRAMSPAFPSCVALALVLPAFAMLLGSCSVVFTAGVQGRVVDGEIFSQSADAGGIDGVEVYLYIRERPRRLDRERYETEGLLPNETEEGRYYLETVTNTVGGEAGSFSFPTFYWNDLLPTYGRTGDRRDVFFLLYHPEYGLVDYTASIVSDTTNTLAPIELIWLYREAIISGRIVRAGTSAGVGGVMVTAYVADGWDGSVFTYQPEDPQQTTTGPDGYYSITLSLLRSVLESAGSGSALLTFSESDHLIDSSVDPLLDESVDVNDDGEADVTYETPPLEADETTEMDTISIKQVSFSESLEGRVGVDTGGDGNIDSGTNGAVVHLYFNAAASPAPADPPDFTTTTQNLLVDQDVEAGWFSFSDLDWYDDLYTGSQSTVTCYLDVDSDGDGSVEVDNRLVTLYSNTSNTVQVVLP